MGRLVAYSAAMSRVLIGLECLELVAESEEREAAGGGGSDSQDENRPEEGGGGGGGKQPRATTLALLSPVAARLKLECGASVAPDELYAMCHNPDGEFWRVGVDVHSAVVGRCDRLGAYEAADEMEDTESYLHALQAAQLRFKSGRGVSPADLKRPRTLEMMLLAEAHRLATRLRAAAARKP